MNSGGIPRSEGLARHVGLRRPFFVVPLLFLFLFISAAESLRAVLWFDGFMAYDGIVPEASWFPIVCEVKNDGPSFTGTVEVKGGGNSQDQTLLMSVELPTGTLKRIVLPIFSSARGYTSWDVRLLD